MASLYFHKNQARIQFESTEGKRATLYLGKVSEKDAKSFLSYFDELLSAVKTNRAPSAQIIIWSEGLSRSLQDKLANYGLISIQPKWSLEECLEKHLQLKKGMKERTLTNIRVCIKRAIAFFGKGTRLSQITEEKCRQFKSDLEKRYSQATVSQTIKKVKGLFRFAVKSKAIQSDPFQGIPAGKEFNTDRQFFVSSELAARVLEACPDRQWKIIFGLARIGGLRVPSEIIPLRWTDIDFENKQFLVTSPKTEHHVHGENRWVPLFPELEELLREELQAPGRHPDFVIHLCRDSTQNLRTQFLRILRRAMVEPWPKPFGNLRASRATELRNFFPAHDVNLWLGHSQVIASRHYLTAQRDFWESAKVLPTMKRGTDNAKSNVTRSENNVKSNAASDRQMLPDVTQTHQTDGVRQPLASGGNSGQSSKIPPRGFEPLS
ncbi:MAG: tyrosine-type recombinase/integrase [Gemmataceae bacterium]